MYSLNKYLIQHWPIIHNKRINKIRQRSDPAKRWGWTEITRYSAIGKALAEFQDKKV